MRLQLHHAASAISPGHWRVMRWAGVAGLLLVPLIAMQFSDEVNWTIGDFAFAAIMLSSVTILYDLASSRLRRVAAGRRSFMAGTVLALGTGFVTIWINMAVGIVGNSDDPRNLGFFAVVLAAMAGAFAAWGRATALARAMLAAGGLQLLHMFDLFMADTFVPFCLVLAAGWLTSAGLFMRAAKVPDGAAAA